MEKYAPYVCAICHTGYGDKDTAMTCYETCFANSAVDRPAHYNQGGIEAIEAIKASMSHEEFEGYLKGNAMKYLWRYRHKGKPEQDLRKAKWYLDRLITEVGGE